MINAQRGSECTLALYAYLDLSKSQSYALSELYARMRGGGVSLRPDSDIISSEATSDIYRGLSDEDVRSASAMTTAQWASSMAVTGSMQQCNDYIDQVAEAGADVLALLGSSDFGVALEDFAKLAQWRRLGTVIS